MAQAFKAIMDAIRSTDVPKRSAIADRAHKEPYFSTPVEMSARMFEDYVLHRMSEMDASNDYLVNLGSKGAFEVLMAGGWPYTEKGEMPAIAEAYERLFDTVDTRESTSPSGKLSVAMFSIRQPAPPLMQFPPIVTHGKVPDLVNALDDEGKDPQTGKSTAYLKAKAGDEASANGEALALLRYPDTDSLRAGLASARDEGFGDPDGSVVVETDRPVQQQQVDDEFDFDLGELGDIPADFSIAPCRKTWPVQRRTRRYLNGRPTASDTTHLYI